MPRAGVWLADISLLLFLKRDGHSWLLRRNESCSSVTPTLRCLVFPWKVIIAPGAAQVPSRGVEVLECYLSHDRAEGTMRGFRGDSGVSGDGRSGFIGLRGMCVCVL